MRIAQPGRPCATRSRCLRASRQSAGYTVLSVPIDIFALAQLAAGSTAASSVDARGHREGRAARGSGDCRQPTAVCCPYRLRRRLPARQVGRQVPRGSKSSTESNTNSSAAEQMFAQRLCSSSCRSTRCASAAVPTSSQQLCPSVGCWRTPHCQTHEEPPRREAHGVDSVRRGYPSPPAKGDSSAVTR